MNKVSFLPREKKAWHNLRIVFFFSVFLVSLLILSTTASATCAHQNLGSNVWSEASHPHAYYRFCADCGEKVYIGGYATKAHGDGSWGSGTCPSCGTHEYIGQTCTTGGVCACGATAGALGHDYSYSTIYSEAAHPHYYYRSCQRCGYHHYTGGHATKTHGDGSWGSGTCPSCGEHSYIGQSCVNEGVCSCGATIPALGHVAGASFYHETAHPHKEYSICQRCSGKAYTGATETRPHGNGTSGTCKYCGTHFYENQTILPPDLIEHPHKTVSSCVCGSTINNYHIVRNCSICSSNQRTAYNTKSEDAVFIFVGSDSYGTGYIGIPIPVSVHTRIEYTNIYNHPDTDVTPFLSYLNYPSFASFSTLVCAYVTGSHPEAPPISAIAGSEVVYYNGGTLIFSQTLSPVVVDSYQINACAPDLWTLSSSPTIANYSGIFYMIDGISGSKITSSTVSFS